VERVIHQLGLTEVADHYIGSVDKRGLSGGEKKRVAIGIELVVDPPVLLLDEPTTGLDASNAKSVMEVLTNLVLQHQRIVICTVHQPRSEIFFKLGGVTLLGGSGQVVYSGNAGTAACDYFATNTGCNCPPHMNAADFVLDCLGTMNGHQTDQLVQLHARTFVEEVIEEVREEAGGKEGKAGKAGKDTKRHRAAVFDVTAVSSTATNCCTQASLLFVRANRQLFRNPTLVLLHYFVPLVVGVAFGVVYRGIKPDISGIQNYAGSFFTVQVFWCLVSITAVDTWNAHRVLVSRFFVFLFFCVCCPIYRPID
jgi:hypothetical protein